MPQRGLWNGDEAVPGSPGTATDQGAALAPPPRRPATLPPGPGAAGGRGLWSNEDPHDPLAQSVDQARTITVDANELLRMQRLTGYPRAYIEQNLPKVVAEVDQRDFDTERLRRQNPKLSAWITEDPVRAAALKKDAGKLAAVEPIMVFGANVQRAYDAWRWATAPLVRGVNQVEALRGSALEWAGELTGERSWARDGKTIRERHERHLARMGPTPSVFGIRGPADLANTVYQSVGEQIPLMAVTTAGGVLGGAAATTVGVPVTLGAAIGAFLPGLALGVGEVQSDIKRAAPGLEAPGEVLLGGTAMAALDTVVPGMIGKRLAATFGLNVADSIVKQALAAQVKSSWLKRTAKGTVSGIGWEGLTEALQKAIADVTSSGATTLEMDWLATGKAMLEEGLVGGLVGGTFAGAGAAVTARREERLAEAAGVSKQFWEQLGAVTADSEFIKQQPQAAQEFFQRATRNGPIEFVYIPTTAFRAHFTAQGMDPAQQAEALTGKADALERAEADDIDLQVPTGAYAAHVAPTEHHAALFPDIKLGNPKAYSLRAADELTQRVAAEVAATADPNEDIARQVEQRLVDQMVAQGVPLEVAIPEAENQRRRLMTRADRLGEDALALATERPFEVTVSDAGQPAAAGAPVAVPRSPTPRGETSEQAGRRRQVQVAALTQHAVAMARLVDPSVDPALVAREVELRTGLLEEQRAAQAESGRGQDLLRAIAGYGGIKRDEDTGGEFDWFVESADTRGKVADRGRRSTWNAVPGVFDRTGESPRALTFAGMVRSLMQDPRFAYLEDDPNKLMEAIDQALRAAQDITALPGSEDLAQVGISPGVRWWDDPWSVITEAAEAGELEGVEEGDTSFDVAELEGRPQPIERRVDPAARARFDAIIESLYESKVGASREELAARARETPVDPTFAAEMEAAAARASEMLGRAPEPAPADSLTVAEVQALEQELLAAASEPMTPAPQAALEPLTVEDALARLNTLPAVPETPGAVQAPFPVLTDVDAATRLYEAAGGLEGATVQMAVPLELLVATQPHIFADVAAQYAAGQTVLGPAGTFRAGLPPLLLHYQGRYYIADGTHRAAGAWVTGAPTLEAVVAEVDPAKLGAAPVTDPELFQKDPAAADSPAYKDIVLHLADRPDEAGRLRRHTAQGLIDHFARLPEDEEMAAIAQLGRAAKGWYAQSRKAITKVFGQVDGLRFAALLAASSPKVSVKENFQIATAMWARWVAAGRPNSPKKIEQLFRKGRTLPSHVNNVVRALATTDPANIRLSGPKVHSFTFNLWGYMHEVTLDSWMAKYALVDQTVFKGKGKLPGKGAGYLAFIAKTRRVAKFLTEQTGERWTPAEVQETVWAWSKTITEIAQAANESVITVATSGRVTDAAIMRQAGGFNVLLRQDAQVRTILEGAGYGEVLRAFDRAAARESRAGTGRAASARTVARRSSTPAVIRAAARLEGARLAEKQGVGIRQARKLAQKALEARAQTRTRGRAGGELTQRTGARVEVLTGDQVEDFAEQTLEAIPGLAAFELRYQASTRSVRLETLAANKDAPPGTGTAAMQRLVAWADQHKVILELGLPDKGWQPTKGSKKTSSRARLTEFYRRFGFTRNTGRRKRYDLSLFTSMYRDPQDNELYQIDTPLAKAPLYSRILRTVETSTQAKANGAQWKATIKNSKLGINGDEFLLTNVGDLEDGKTYTREEVLEYLEANQVRLDTVEFTEGGAEIERPTRSQIEVIADRRHERRVDERIRDLEDDGDPPSMVDADDLIAETDMYADGDTGNWRLVWANTRNQEPATDFEYDTAAEAEADRTRVAEAENEERQARWEEDIRERANDDVDYDEIYDEVEQELLAAAEETAELEGRGLKYGEWQMAGPREEDSAREVFLTAPTTSANIGAAQRALIVQLLESYHGVLAEHTNRHGADSWQAQGVARLMDIWRKLRDGGDFRTRAQVGAASEAGYGGQFFAALTDEENRYIRERAAHQAQRVADLATEGKGWKDGHDDYDEVENPVVRLRYNIRPLAGGERVLFLDELQPPMEDEQPKMPALFLKNWREVGMRYALLKAAELNVDYLAWTPGEVQAFRYNVRRVAELVAYYPATKQLAAYDKQGEEILRHYNVEPDALSRYLGKQPAAALLATPYEEGSTSLRWHHVEERKGLWVIVDVNGEQTQDFAWVSQAGALRKLEDLQRTIGSGRHALSGKGLELGGEGLIQLYDRDLPAIVNKQPAVKGTGGKTTTVDIIRGEQRRFLITPDGLGIRELREGLPEREVFRRDPTPEGAREVSDKLAELTQAREPDLAPSPAIAMTPALRAEILGKGQALFQEDEQGDVKGAYSPDLNRLRLVAGKADLSTWLHENGHQFLEELFSDAARVDAAQPGSPKRAKLREDAELVLRWFGFTGSIEDWRALPLESRRSNHEAWARAFELYLMEGKAPSVELEPLFATFKRWMVTVYRSILNLRLAAGNDWIEPTPEIRGVMDRLLATDEAIEAAQSEANIQPLFTDPAIAGVDALVYGAYLEVIRRANDQARADIDRRVMVEYRREQQAWWKEERLVQRQLVADEVSRDPAMAAQALMRTGTLPSGQAPGFGDGTPLKLSKQDVINGWGRAMLKRLRMGRDYLYTVDGGLKADVLAPLLGFPNGDALLEAVTSAPRFEQVIEAETDRRMREKHGDLVLEGMPLRAIAEGAVQEGRADIISAELRALTQGMAGVGIPDTATINAAATVRIGQLTVRELTPGQFLAAANRYSKQAFEAFAKNDRQAAILAKQRELAAMAQYRAARDMREQVDAHARKLRAYDQNPKVRGRIGKAGADYLDQIDQLLEQYELRRVPLNVLDKRKRLRDFLVKAKNDGVPIEIPDAVVEDARQVNWQELSVSQFEGIYEAVEHLAHMARFKERMIKIARGREFQAVKGELETSIRDNKDKRREHRTATPGERFRKTIEERSTAHLKLATLARIMDGFGLGPMFDYVITPLQQSASDELERKGQAEQAIGKLFTDHYRPAELRAMYRYEYLPVLGEADNPLSSISKMERLLVLLNWGNDTNRQRVRDGHGWTDLQVQAIIDTLDRRDTEFVQKVWDYLETFRPDIGAKQRRVVGFEPEWVTPTPVFTRHGELRGGYFPIVYDNDKSAAAGSHEDADMAKIAGLAAYTHAVPLRGHVERRSEGDIVRPVLLSFDVIFRHVDKVIHDLTHHEVLVDVGRLLDPQKGVGQAIIDTHGADVYRTLKRAIQDIALGDQPARDGMEKAASALRNGATAVGLAWNFQSAALQPLGLFQTWQHIGLRWMMRGFTEILGDPLHVRRKFNEAYDKSQVLRTRHQSLSPELKAAMAHIGLDEGSKWHPGTWVDKVLTTVTRDTVTKAAIASTYFSMIQKMQAPVDMVTWWGAYHQAIADPANTNPDGTFNEARAIASADRAVIDTQGGGSIMDLASVQRGSQYLKLWTNFYSYMNVTYNLQTLSKRGAQFEAKRGGRKLTNPITMGKLAGDYLLLLVAPAVIGSLLRDAFKLEDDPEDYLKNAAMAGMTAPLGLVIFLREISGLVAGMAGYEGPPGMRGLVGLGKFGRQLGEAVYNMDPDKIRASGLRALNNAGGAFFHYPAGQVGKTIEGLAALIRGETSSPTALAFGPPEED